MPELGKSGSVGATGGQLPVATRPKIRWRRESSKGMGAGMAVEADQRYTAPARLVFCGSCRSVDATNPQVANSGVRPR